MPVARCRLQLRRSGIAVVLGLALLCGWPTRATPAQLRGRVTDASGEVGFAGALVRLVELQRTAVTDGDGHFRLAEVPAGEYTLRIDYVGAPVRQQRIAVTAADLELGALPLGAALPMLDNVLVVGQIAGQSAAINSKRGADNIIEALSADAIGQLPDQNVAEALERLPGVSVLTEQGEGRYIAVRGIDPNLNSISIAGARVPSGEDDARQVPLDLIPAELLERAVVAKTLTPDMDADAIGGAIQIEALSAFDRRERAAGARLQAHYDGVADAAGPLASAQLTRVLALQPGRFGIAVAGSASLRDTGWEGIETGAGWPLLEGPDGSFRSAEQSEQRAYRARLERVGLTLGLDHRPDPDSAYHLRVLLADFDDTQTQVGNHYRFDTATPLELTQQSAVFEDAVIEKTLTARLERRRIESWVFGGNRQSGDWRFEFGTALSKAREAEPDHLDARFEAEAGLAWLGTGPRPLLTPTDAVGFDPDAFALDEVVFERTDIRDREAQASADARRELAFGRAPGFVQLGAKLRRRRKTAAIDLTTYDAFGAPATLAAFTGARDYGLGPLGPVVDAGAFRAFVDANLDRFELDEAATRIDSAASDYRIDEDVDAVYLMAGAELGTVHVLGGVRLERTQLRASGTRVSADGESLSLDPVELASGYHDLLPGLHLRRRLGPRWLLRAALTRSLARPSFGDLAPAQRIETEEGDDGAPVRRAELGNPALRPYRAGNFDLSLEYYGQETLDAFSLALFAKRIDDFVVRVDRAGEGEFAGFERAIVPVNGERARLRGIELAWTRRFASLPPPWDGFLLGVNVSRVDSEARLPLAGRTLPLPHQSDTVANLMLGYERGDLGLRVAAHWRSERLIGLEQPQDPAFDVYEDGALDVDVGAWYRLGSHWRLELDALNLGDRPLYEYYGDPRYHARYERYGRSYRLGLRYRY